MKPSPIMDQRMANLSNASTELSQWLFPALTSPLGVECILLLIIASIVLLVTLRGSLRLRAIMPAQAKVPRLPGAWFFRDHSGTVTIEFALVFPILLITALFILQTMQLMTGNIFIHYSSFVAARSAIVQIPTNRSTPDESTNSYVESPDSEKNRAIRAAAVWALVPVSGRFASGDAPTADFIKGLGDYFTKMQTDQPGWVTAQAADRLRYAYANTAVDLSTTSSIGDTLTVTPLHPGDVYLWGPRQPITVNVHHKLVLSVPCVGAFFASGRHAAGSGSTSIKDNSSSFYSLVTASCTLVNEGYSTALPQPPSLPRNP